MLGLTVQLNDVGVLVVIEVNITVCPVQIVLLGTIILAVGTCAKAKLPTNEKAMKNSFLNTS